MRKEKRNRGGKKRSAIAGPRARKKRTEEEGRKKLTYLKIVVTDPLGERKQRFNIFLCLERKGEKEVCGESSAQVILLFLPPARNSLLLLGFPSAP